MSRASLTFMSSSYSCSCWECPAWWFSQQPPAQPLDLSILESQLPMLLSMSDSSLQGSALAFEGLDLSLESADILVHLINFSLHITKVVSVFLAVVSSSSYLIWYTVSGLVWLWLAILSYGALTSAMMPSMSRE